MEKFICIHGHFYQPPRENPWLEAIEVQDSAYPYHDWNERITAECYAPNMAARILDGEGFIVDIANNYSRMSFNIGPTLLSWLEANDPDVYRAIQEADARSLRHFSGHGSAMAQSYNHTILPLSNRRDKETQVLWGLYDFKSRFGRDPEGMWLPETAVDLESLDIMAEHGIKFTVLAPHQAARVRKTGQKNWRDVGGARVDTTVPYQVTLPSGRTIVVYFYDGARSRAVAFEGILSKGENFANRLMSGFDENGADQLVHIATDGETYGHHHRHGEMALAYALHYLEKNKLARLTNYSEFLATHPVANEAEIIENTAWSCAHGVERWRSDCGCNAGRGKNWNQQWRAPLRAALDWLRDSVAPKFEEKAKAFLKDPWAARNDYIAIIRDRSDETRKQFLAKHATHDLTDAEKITVLKLLELQRHAQLMYTSCGWFFDEISGIETVQVIAYAGRTIQLAEELFSETVEPAFLDLLEKAPSNIPANKNGRVIYERFVKPAIVDLEKVGAHYAVSSLFDGNPDRAYCYAVELKNFKLLPVGKARIVIGRAVITSEITRESADLMFGVLHLGDHNISGGIRPAVDDATFKNLKDEITRAFTRADLPEFIRILDKNFAPDTFSLKALFHDEQRKILDVVLDSTLIEAETNYRHIYEDNAPLMRFLSDLNIPLPRVLYSAAEYALNNSLRRALEEDEPDLGRITSLLEEAEGANVTLDSAGLAFTLRRTTERVTERFLADTDNLSNLLLWEAVVRLARSMPFEVVFWKAQNAYFHAMKAVLPGYRDRAAQSDAAARLWIGHFVSLGTHLHVRVAE